MGRLSHSGRWSQKGKTTSAYTARLQQTTQGGTGGTTKRSGRRARQLALPGIRGGWCRGGAGGAERALWGRFAVRTGRSVATRRVRFARELAGALLLALEAWLHLAASGARGGGLAGADAGDPHGRRAGAAGCIATRRPGALPLMRTWAGATPGAGRCWRCSWTGPPTCCLPTLRAAGGATAGVLSAHRAPAAAPGGGAVRTARWRRTRPGRRRGGCRAGRERVVAPLYVEADGVWVKTQREPAHRTGAARSGVRQRLRGLGAGGGAHPGAPAPALRPGGQAGVLPPARAETLPFWEGASLALHCTYDLEPSVSGRGR